MKTIVEFLLTKRLEKPKPVKAKIGDYLHRDGSINTTPDEDVIGVCVIASGQISDSPEARFMSVTGCTEDGKQSNKELKCIWGPNDTKTGIIDEYDGYENTQKLVQLGSDYEAAIACSKFSPGYKDENWYLPASKELEEYGKNFKLINEKIENCGNPNKLIASYDYWSSTESSFY